ncbi:phosphoribosylformylglycinamidine synthase subunit PurS [candidate division KSB1 bacterium]|nr:phosphoribosylformylglycinamidine synthase subunit PurS [candidate division KSB1 bacterium]
MATYHVKVFVQLKEGILDPQGKAVEHALLSLGFQGMSHVRIGKMIELQVDGETLDAAKNNVQRACEKLLTNPIIETYEFELSTNGKVH